jgi:hypothetical protein
MGEALPRQIRSPALVQVGVGQAAVLVRVNDVWTLRMTFCLYYS